MRILHVLDHSLPLHSGYAFRSAAIIREQQRIGWQTAQITGPKHDCAESEQTIDSLRYWRTRHSIPALDRVPVLNQADVVLALRRRLSGVIREFQPDIIHAHSPCLNGLAAVSAARSFGLPFVYELRASWEDAAVSHGTTTEGSLRYQISRWLETRVVRSADAVTTICEGLRRDIMLRGVPGRRVTVIPNAVDLGHFSEGRAPDPALRARFCAPEDSLVGFFGSFYAYEGLDLLLEAARLLRRPQGSIHLLLVGGGPEEVRLRRMAEELGIGRQVSFAGRVPQKDIPLYYAIADLLVYPRRGTRLTELVTPLKPLEAMAQGRIVVASDVGGHRELIRDHATGFLFRPDDPQALADAVLAVLASPELDAVRRRARNFVEAERTWHHVVSGYRAVYETLAGSGPEARQGAGGTKPHAA